MSTWKCEKCGYQFKDKVPPETCPSCRAKCAFLDVTVYTPDRQFENADDRIKPRPDK